MSWVKYVDRALEAVDQALDGVRKTKRRRLDRVPEPPQPPDPFVERVAPATADAPEEAPLGDPALVAQVYGRRTCDATGRVVRVLRDRGIDARFIDMADPENASLEARLVRATRAYETPYVFVRGAFVGGEAAVMAKAKDGTLDEAAR